MDQAKSADQVIWDLSDLYTAQERLDKDLEEAEQAADRLSEKCRGKIADLAPLEFFNLLRDYEKILDRSGKAGTYAYLNWSTNTEDPARGALLQKATEYASRLQQKLLFIELEFAKMTEEKAEKLIGHPDLAHYRHWLRNIRRHSPHLLTEPEEKILAEKAVTGKSAWSRFFEEVLSAARYELAGEILPQQSVLSKLYEPDRKIRRSAAECFTRGLKATLRITTSVFNNILADKYSDDRLRSYPSWISARNLDNQTDDATVEALIKAVTSRYNIVSRYYRLKKKLLGLDELYDYDRYAPLPAANRKYSWDEARKIVLSAYAAFHPRMGEIGSFFFEKRWIDAAVRAGKRGGAYAHGAVPSVHPYIFLNFEGTPRHVMTLAHELGHGVHQALSREQGILLADAPLTTAETASVFGEMLVFHEIMDRERDSRVRLSMLVQKIEDSFATVFRQTAMNRFEDAVHETRRGKGELSPERFSELWMSTQKAMFQDSVTLTEDYGIWWSYIPHFIHTPGYVYAYAFGELLVLALYARYREVGDEFPDLYLKMLKSGGSNWPEELVKPMGVNLKDPQFWDNGLRMIETLLEEAEEMAEA